MPVFNPKLFKASVAINKCRNEFVEDISKTANKVSNNIIPSPFIVDRIKVQYQVFDDILNKTIVKEYYVNREYGCVENYFSAISSNFSYSGLTILCKLIGLLQLNKNYLYLPTKVLEVLCKLDVKSVVKGINELIINKVLARTNRKGIYVVNHNIIFKGDYYKFEETYNKLFGKLNVEDIIDNETNKVHIDGINLKEEKELLIKQLNKISKLNYSFLIDKKEEEIKEEIKKLYNLKQTLKL